jgi:hypothetical protein
MTEQRDATDNTRIGPQDNTFHCEHCGQTITLTLPLTAKIVVSIINSFVALHQWCGTQQVFATDAKQAGGSSSIE